MNWVFNMIELEENHSNAVTTKYMYTLFLHVRHLITLWLNRFWPHQEHTRANIGSKLAKIAQVVMNCFVII